jgi:hypothetical protein
MMARSFLVHRKITRRSYGVKPRAGGPVSHDTRPVSFEMAPDEDAVDLYAPARLRRGPITGVRAALSVYQDGRCAYCHTPFTDIGTSRVAVDHVLPWVLMTREWQDGEHDRPPAADWMPWLEQRGEHLIASHHPLRETLISQGPYPTL